MIKQYVERVMISESNNIFVQFFRYGVVGALAACIDISLFYVVTGPLHINHLAANTASFIIALVIDYFLSREWVFNKKVHNFARDFTLFSVIGIVGLVFSNVILYILIDCRVLSLPLGFLREDLLKLAAKFIAVFLVAIWNFTARRIFVFSSKESKMENFIAKLLKDKNENIYIKMFRFVIIGGIATAVDIGIFHLLTNMLMMNHLLANPISFSFGLVISYYFTRSWVFNRVNHDFLRDFTLFAVTSLMGLGISTLVLFLLVDLNMLKNIMSAFHYDHDSIIKLSAKVIASFIVLVWNFITKNIIVFK